MKTEHESSHEEDKKKKRLIISGELTIGDIERIKAAFEIGELKHLGIASIQVQNEEEYESAKTEWQREERARKNKRKPLLE